jgi:ribosome biogenesis GTPase
MGMHTTTFSEMIPLNYPLSSFHLPPSSLNTPPSTFHLPLSSYLIDTPGIKGFGTFDMEPEEITGYFKDIFHFSKDCRFSNCTHTHEPGCAVLKALEDHYIAESRYQSYLSMLDDKDEGKYRESQ